MDEYKPPFTITNEILSYVSLISEKHGKITVTGWNPNQNATRRDTSRRPHNSDKLLCS